MITTVFIDDGINPEAIPKIIPFEEYIADASDIRISDNAASTESHGTLCYQIFRDNVAHAYRLISIKILDSETGTGTKSALLTALNWCAAQNIDLINMSMGTRQYLDFAPIAEAVSRLNKTIIVAACSNENELTFPACLKTVIGVRNCNNAELRDRFVYLPDAYDQIDVFTNVEGGANSLAAPLITARVLDYLAQGDYGIAAIKQKLQNDTVSILTDYNFHKRFFHKWEEINVPSVFIPDRDAIPKIKALIAKFISDGYRAVCYSATEETNAANLIFKPENPDFLNLSYNFNLPDIIFLHVNTWGIEPDIVIKSSNGSDLLIFNGEICILHLNDSAKVLFAKIIELLGAD